MIVAREERFEAEAIFEMDVKISAHCVELKSTNSSALQTAMIKFEVCAFDGDGRRKLKD